MKSRDASHLICGIACQPETRKLPASGRCEEIAIGRADVSRRCDAGATSQNHLGGHELAVILAERSRQRTIPRIAGIRRGGPLPNVAEDLLQPGPRRSSGGMKIPALQ